MNKMKMSEVPLIIEDHPDDYDGPPFITLIRYNHINHLVIVDDQDSKKAKVYVLDFCGPERIDEQKILAVATQWYEEGANHPISVEFSRREMTRELSPIYRTFNKNFIMRVIGPFPDHEMRAIQSIRKKKKKSIAA